MASKIPKDKTRAMPPPNAGKELSINEIECLIGLIRKGDPVSLAKARNIVGIGLSELSKLIGVSDNLLNAWEMEEDAPSQKYLITWRLKLGDFIEGIISIYLRTDDPELIHQFWEIMWRLSDF